MSYRDRLNRWIIVRLLPNMQPIIVGRFHKRSDAEGHCQFLCRQLPDRHFEVVFDGSIHHSDPNKLH